LRIALVDDEQLILDNLNFLLAHFNDVEVAFSSTDALAAIQLIGEQKPDAVFLDITMPLINGLEFAERVRERSPGTRIVFITAYEQYALDAFRVNAVDYLLKPVTTSKLVRSLDRLREGKDGGSEGADPKAPGQGAGRTTSTRSLKIPAYQDNRIFLIDPSKALYIEAAKRDLYVVSGQGRYMIRESMNYWENALKGRGWLRCHRGFLVNTNYIEEVSPMFNSTYLLSLKGCETEITVSRTYIAEFKSFLNL